MIYISPPFGTYIQPKHAIPVLGSFTVLPRPGWFGQAIRTVRKVPGGWVNRMGLRNPGIDSVQYRPGVVVSLSSVVDDDWKRLHEVIADKGWPAHLIELNLSCPNVAEQNQPTRAELEAFTKLHNPYIIAKLPPIVRDAIELTELCLEAGIRHIHLSNTFPSPRGGVSGAQLRVVNVPLVELIAARVQSKARVIAGGGNYAMEHIQRYRDAGASDISLGSVFFTPLRGWRLYNDLSQKEGEEIWKRPT